MPDISRVAVVTGAAGGIGRAIVRGLLAKGVRVAGVDRDREPLDALAAAAREGGKSAAFLTVHVDLTADGFAERIAEAAIEALSAIMAKDLDGSGVAVNVLIPGGVTNTPMISDEAGFARDRLIQPELMAPPLVWLVSDAAGTVTGQRFLAVNWDTSLAPNEAAEKAGSPIAWTSIATLPITPGRT
jgi:NAD(P)-dependent dehydrogenase (short-subunit alcohol dehydrogenase family)